MPQGAIGVQIVPIYMAKRVVPGQVLRAIVNTGQIFCTVSIPAHARSRQTSATPRSSPNSKISPWGAMPYRLSCRKIADVLGTTSITRKNPIKTSTYYRQSSTIRVCHSLNVLPAHRVSSSRHFPHRENFSYPTINAPTASKRLTNIRRQLISGSLYR